MGKISKIVSIALGLMSCVAVNSCSDDFLLESSGVNGVDMDNIVEVKLPLNLGKGINTHIVTRATDQMDKDSQLSGIMVFVYENKGGDPINDKRLAYHLFESPSASLEGSTGGWIPDRNDATCGYLKLYLPAGDVYIYLIGNATGSFIDFFPNLGDIKLENRQDFLDHVQPKWNGNMFTVDGYLPLVGKVNNSTGACHIGVDDSGKSFISYKKDDEPDKDYFISQEEGNYVEDNSFVLKRLMCKITMEFKCPEGVKFKPLTYKFYHCSEFVSPTEESWAWQKYLNTVDSQTMTFDAQSQNSFTVYLPENIRDYDPNIGGKPKLDFRDRDLVVKDGNGENELEGDKVQPGHSSHYLFRYAPEKSTYVEVTGKFDDEKNGISADTRYILHLGDFSKGDFNEFSLRRDHHYKYTVTVNGVSDIIVEVTGGNEKNPAAYGIVFEGGARQLLDAHYEQVEMRFVREQVDKGVYIFAQTPYGNLNCKYLPLENKLDETYTNSPSTIEEAKKLLKWVEFRRQDAKGALAKYGSDVKNIFDALGEVCQGSGEFYYTCFVDEFVYTKNPITGAAARLEDFVNVDGRLFSIGSNLLFSKDKESVVVQSVYTLKQRSISTFYDPTDGRNKYGVETIDEIGPMKYGSPKADNTTDFKHGRSLTMAEIGSDRSVDWSKVGWILNADGSAFARAGGAITGDNAYRAVLTRNRDLNGNGSIDDDEFRWYTPSRDQVIGLWIGEPALPAEAALYPESTQGMVRNPKGAVWPVFTSNGGKNRVVWAEEGCSYNDLKTSQGDGGYLYAVRNLGNNNIISGGGYAQEPDKYYHYDPATRVVTLYLANSCLRAYSNRELAVHNERSPINRPYRSFQIAKHPATEQVSVDCNKAHSGYGTFTFHKAMLTTRNDAANALRTIASDYLGDGEAEVGGNASWRLPNQRELALMLIALGDNFGYNDKDYYVTGARCDARLWEAHRWTLIGGAPKFLLTRTSFSVKGYQNNGNDAFYCYDPEHKIIQMDDINSSTARVLCVRDVQ